MIFTTHLSASQALQVTGSFSVTGSKGTQGATGITFKSSALRNSGSVNIYGDLNLTGNLLVNGAEIVGGGNYQSLQSDTTIAAGFNQFYYGPVTIPVGISLTIENTANLKIKDIEDI
mgnify:CR=1 FL=1